MASNPVGWFEIYVQDTARARKFYEAVFGMTLTRLDMPGSEMWTFPMDPEAKGASGALVKMDGMASGANSTLVYFSCEDCAEEAERAAKHGGAITQAKFSIGEYGFVALVTDTEGNLIGLHSQR